MSTILLIEDEPAIRRSLAVSLMQEGHEVDPCEDGLSGLEKIHNYDINKKNVDAVILDMMLPDIHGLKILGLIKEKHPGLPVILITGFGDSTIEEEVRTRQGDLYLEKPIQMERLEDYLNGILRNAGKSAEAAKDAKSETLLSGYVFLKLKEDSDFYETFRDIYFDQNIMYCDAVRGAFDVIILAHGKTGEEIDAFVKRCLDRKGVQDAVYSPIEKPMLSSSLASVISEMDRFLLGKKREEAEAGKSNKNMCTSYAMVEVEGEKFEHVYRSLYYLDNVVSCDVMKNQRAILLMLKAPLFEHIDELVTRKIARLDGVLRVTQYPIMKILDM